MTHKGNEKKERIENNNINKKKKITDDGKELAHIYEFINEIFKRNWR